MAEERLPGRVYLATVDAVTFHHLLGVLDKVRWAYLESETAINCKIGTHLVELPFEGIDQYSIGRAFGADYELRWRRNVSGVFQIQVFSEIDLDGPADLKPSDDMFITLPVRIMLWGTLAKNLDSEHALYDNQANYWVETRIPKPLQYPVNPPTRRVIVQARNYLLHGMIVATRWQRLEGIDEL